MRGSRGRGWLWPWLWQAGRSPLGPILICIADTRVADAPVSLAVLTCRAGVSAV